jgi:hypothetical protein
LLRSALFVLNPWRYVLLSDFHWSHVRRFAAATMSAATMIAAARRGSIVIKWIGMLKTTVSVPDSG